MFTSFQSRLRFLTGSLDKLIISRDIKGIYRVLESESSRLAEILRTDLAEEIYQLIA